MATETLKIEAIVEGADTRALERMRADLDNLSASTGRGASTARQHAEATKALDKNLNFAWQTAKGFAAAYGAIFSVQAIANWSASAVREFENYEQAMQRVASASSILGQNEDLVRFKIAATTDELQKRTTFDDTQQLVALNSLILSTQDYDLAVAHLPITLDVAAAHGLDAAAAGRMVGMALEGNMFMIGRYVPALRNLTDEEKNAINISRILEQTYRGRAEALGKTIPGTIKIQENMAKDTQKAWGEAFAQVKVSWGRRRNELMEGITDDFISFGRSPMGWLMHSNYGQMELAPGKDRSAGLAALPAQRSKKQEELAVSPLFSRPVAETFHELDVMSRMPKFAYDRWALEKQITAEIEKGGAKYESIVEKSLKILDLLDKEKKVRQEIAGLQAQIGLSGFQEFSGFAGAAEEVDKKLHGALSRQFAGANLRLGGRDQFLSMGDIVGRTEGVSNFSMRQEQALQETLKRPGLSQVFRAQTSEQLFNLNVQQMRDAATPGMAGREFSQSLDAYKGMQREKEAQLTEEVNDRKKLIDKSALSADELVKIRGLMEQLVTNAKINPKGFSTLNRNELAYDG